MMLMRCVIDSTAKDVEHTAIDRRAGTRLQPSKELLWIAAVQIGD